MSRHTSVGEVLGRWFGIGTQDRRELIPGDVISVACSRTYIGKQGLRVFGRLLPMQRFGIWTGKDVILYSEVAGEEKVHRRSMSAFKDGEEKLYLYDFPRSYGEPRQRRAHTVTSCIPPMDRHIWDFLEFLEKRKYYHLYTPEETVARAEGEICRRDVYYPTSEHFAFWCKTGISESHALKELRRWLPPIVY